jgi:hypothetical protein
VGKGQKISGLEEAIGEAHRQIDLAAIKNCESSEVFGRQLGGLEQELAKLKQKK